MAFGAGYLSGAADLIGAAGDVYGALQKPPGQINPQLAGFRGLISTPGYNFGGGALARRNNVFAEGLARQRGDLQNLRSQVTPGFGRLTTAGVNAIRQKAAEASGNLRANLARRGLAGASFAGDLQTRLDAEYDQMEQQFRTQAFTEEMTAHQDLLEQETANLLLGADQEMKELGLSMSFLSAVKPIAITQKVIADATKRDELLQKYKPAGQGGK